MKKILFLTFLNLLFSLPVYASIKVAVMPFEVLSKNRDIKQFGIGTTDTLTNALGSIPEFVMVDRGQLSTIMKEQAFQQAIKVNPNYAFSYYHLGNIYNEQNNLDQSIIQLNKAIVINPNFYSAMINLANIYNRQQNFKEATNMFNNIRLVVSSISVKKNYIN